MTRDLTFLLENNSGYSENEFMANKSLTRYYNEGARAFQIMADFAPVFIWIGEVDNVQRFYFNKVWLDYRGCSLAEEAADGWLRGVHPDDYEALLSACSEASRERKTYKAEYRLRRKDGVFRWVLETGVPFFYPDDQLYGFVGSCVGIGEQKELEGQLYKMAHYDILTGLANRFFFMDRLNHTISAALRYKTMFALLYIDLDGFKAVNDRYGHKTGDMLLIEAAKRLGCTVRESDTTARMGGDEFTVILTRINTEKDALLTAEKIAEEFAKPFFISGRKCNVSASIGVGIFPNDATDPETLIKKADMDMYLKKGKSLISVA